MRLPEVGANALGGKRGLWFKTASWSIELTDSIGAEEAGFGPIRVGSRRRSDVLGNGSGQMAALTKAHVQE